MRSFKSLIAVSGAAALLAGCGLNPFGTGQAGLKIFANVGKAVQKPSQIDDEKNGKEGAAAVVATGAAKRLAKGTAATDPGVDSAKIISHGGSKYTYIEYVTDKPSDDDPDKLMTGVGMVSFSYSPGDPNVAFSDANITAVDSFYFEGKEYKTWNAELCTLVLCVKFDDPNIGSLKPGLTWMWGKNISGDITKGDGDTAFIAVTELDDAARKQYGEGHFFDANTGSDNSGESYAFDFNFEIWHMDETPAYTDYSNNEGEMTFSLPWGTSSDSLHFLIHFYPQYRRTGTITDDQGVVRVRFDWNEKYNTGTIIYYNEDGEEVPSV